MAAVNMLMGILTNPQLSWWITRATGLVMLPTFTTVVVLGILTNGGRRLGRAPRFVTLALHRGLAVASLVFLSLHIYGNVTSDYTGIGLQDVFIPFISHYERFWVGLGSIAVLLLLMLVGTGLARVRLGYRVWRTLHASSWLFFVVAFTHGLGIGDDTHTWWGLSLCAACLIAVVAAFVAGRSKPAWRASTPSRRSAVLEGADK